MSYGFRPDKGIGANIVAYDNPDWLQDINNPMPFEIGKIYHIKGTVTGDKYSLYINNDLVLQINENRFPSGKARVDLSGAIVLFDNVVITGDEVPDAGPSGLTVEPKGKLATTWGQVKY
jgi:hypothetical protein